MELDELSGRVLGECSEHDVSLWDVISRVGWEHRRDHPPPQWLLDRTLSILRTLLGQDLIEATNPQGTIFVRLPMDTDAVIEFIRREWLSLDRYPGTGYVCWFRATPAGKNLAHELHLKGE